jgi:multidrug transporter EmrE-like cation transporter
MALSWWVFAEPVTVTQIIGAAVIVAGIVCLAVAEGGKDTAPHPAL